MEPALNLLLKHEGGFVNDLSDLGGATNYGISLRFLRAQKIINGDIDAKDIEALTPEKAAELYKKEFWEKSEVSRIINQRISNMLFGLCVNLGKKSAIKLFQNAINAVSINKNQLLEVDGVLGDKTIKKANKIEEQQLISSYKYAASAYYRGLTLKNKNLDRFIHGWLQRVNSY
jgi:lysozyme family protein